MKKWIALIVIVPGLLLASAYVFFPTVINSRNIEKINCSINSVNRFMMVENKWNAWWPGTIKYDSLLKENAFYYDGYKYVISELRYNAILIKTLGNDFTVESTIFFIPINSNVVQIEWKYSLETTSNPVYRIHLFLETKKINKSMRGILNSMKTFLEKTENVYGMRIDRTLVKDTILVTTKFSSEQYPATSKIYNEIDGIKKYIATNNAKETNFPMLHVWLDTGYYHTTIAIPVSKTIPDRNPFFIKRMVPGNILVSEVKGGEHRAREALRQLGIYMTDNHLSSPAIPFESLVTDRRKEADSSNWITKIYYPVY